MPANNTNEGQRAELTIQQKQFTIPVLYVAGQIELTEGEAAALQQTYAENLRNNFAARMKAAAEGDNPRELTQEDFDAYIAAYDFGARIAGSRGPRDPVGAEERALALAAVKAAVAKKGRNWSSFSDDDQKAMVTKVVESGRFRAQAERTVAERQQTLAAAEEIDLGV